MRQTQKNTVLVDKWLAGVVGEAGSSLYLTIRKNFCSPKLLQNIGTCLNETYKVQQVFFSDRVHVEN
jgi:hypothetical protein